MRLFGSACCLALSAALSAQSPAGLTDAAILEILGDHVNVQRQSPGIIVGILSPAGRRAIAVGTLGIADSRPVDPDTVFDIGPAARHLAQWVPALGNDPDRLTQSLGMTSTATRPTADLLARLATGHDAQLNAVLRPQAAESFFTTASDLLTFLAALADSNGLGASLPAVKDGDHLFIGVSNAGFSCTMVYDPKTLTGVVVISNARTAVDDLARYVLRPSSPLARPGEMAVNPQTLDLYAGRYAAAPGSVYTVTREGDALMLELPGLPKLRLLAKTQRDFHVAENTRVMVSFDVDAKGQATRLLMKSPTGNVTATRLK